MFYDLQLLLHLTVKCSAVLLSRWGHPAQARPRAPVGAPREYAPKLFYLGVRGWIKALNVDFSVAKY